MIWKGKELEGKYQGIMTLFVKGIEETDRILSLAKEHRISHVYFGAGKTEVCEEMWPVIRELVSYFFISIETQVPVRIPEDIRNSSHILYRIEIPLDLKYLGDMDTIKIEEPKESVRCVAKGHMFYNDFSEYKNDEVVYGK